MEEFLVDPEVCGAVDVSILGSTFAAKFAVVSSKLIPLEGMLGDPARQRMTHHMVKEVASLKEEAYQVCSTGIKVLTASAPETAGAAWRRFLGHYIYFYVLFPRGIDVSSWERVCCRSDELRHIMEEYNFVRRPPIHLLISILQLSLRLAPSPLCTGARSQTFL